MSDSQYLFDLAAKQYNEVADGIEKHFEGVANQLRDWLPRTILPPPPPPPRKVIRLTYWQGLERWVLQHKKLAASIAAFVGTGAALLVLQKMNKLKKRRARRSGNGARTEVVVLAGSPTSPMTTALALDLERRGFIVYVITPSAEDEQHVRNQSRVDILPLNMDLVYPEAAQDQLGRFHRLLSRHHHAFEGAPSHRLTLTGLIIIPETQSSVEPIAYITPETWSTALNAKVLNTIVTTQLLLPLVLDFKSRVIMLTPSVIPSVRPPYHAIESTVTGALGAYTSTLAGELRLEGVDVCHFKLGSLELPGTPHQKHTKDKSNKVRGTSMRKLHETLFDALRSKKPAQTWHVGRGSMVYDLIGGWLPAAVVAQMLGLQRDTATSIRAEENTNEPAVVEEAHEGGELSMQWEKVDKLASAM